MSLTILQRNDSTTSTDPFAQMSLKPGSKDSTPQIALSPPLLAQTHPSKMAANGSGIIAFAPLHPGRYPSARFTDP